MSDVVTALLDRAVSRLRAEGPTLLTHGRAVAALWPTASVEEQEVLAVGMISLRDGVPLLPMECASVFAADVFAYGETEGTEYEGINIGCLVGAAVDLGRAPETAFRDLIQVRTSDGPKLAGPLACAVLLCINESRAAAA